MSVAVLWVACVVVGVQWATGVAHPCDESDSACIARSKVSISIYIHIILCVVVEFILLLYP